MKKILSVRLYNFQSHSDTIILFDEKMNAITGISDQGKTAAFRGIFWALYNRPLGATFMRIGTHHCFVQITFNDGTLITRGIKTNKKDKVEDSYYSVTSPNGTKQDFRGFATSPPEEVMAAHGMAKVAWDEDNEVSLNLSEQLDGPFLLGSSNSIKAKAIGKLNGAFVIDGALIDVGADIRHKTDEKKELSRNIERYSDELKGFEGLDDFGERVAYFENKLRELKERSRARESLQNALTSRHKLERIKETSNLIIELTDNFEGMRERISELETAVGRAVRAHRLVNDRTALTTRASKGKAFLKSTEGVEGMLERIEKLTLKTATYQAVKQRAVAAQILKDKKGEAQHLMDSTRSIGDLADRLSKLKALIYRRDELEKLMTKKSALVNRRAGGLKFLGECQRVYKETVEEYTKVVANLGHCPVCTSKIDNAKEIVQKTLF